MQRVVDEANRGFFSEVTVRRVDPATLAPARECADCALPRKRGVDHVRGGTVCRARQRERDQPAPVKEDTLPPSKVTGTHRGPNKTAGLIVDLLRKRGPMRQAELLGLLQVGKPTVSRALQPLKASGQVLEAGRVRHSPLLRLPDQEVPADAVLSRPTKPSEEDKRAAAATARADRRAAKEKQILDVLPPGVEMKQAELAAASGIPGGTITRYLREMETDGRLVSRQHGHAVLWRQHDCHDHVVPVAALAPGDGLERNVCGKFLTEEDSMEDKTVPLESEITAKADLVVDDAPVAPTRDLDEVLDRAKRERADAATATCIYCGDAKYAGETQLTAHAADCPTGLEPRDPVFPDPGLRERVDAQLAAGQRVAAGRTLSSDERAARYEMTLEALELLLANAYSEEGVAALALVKKGLNP